MIDGVWIRLVVYRFLYMLVGVLVLVSIFIFLCIVFSVFIWYCYRQGERC